MNVLWGVWLGVVIVLGRSWSAHHSSQVTLLAHNSQSIQVWGLCQAEGGGIYGVVEGDCVLRTLPAAWSSP